MTDINEENFQNRNGESEDSESSLNFEEGSENQDAGRKKSKKRVNRKLLLFSLGGTGLLGIATGLIFAFLVVPSLTNDNYWESLQSQGIEDEYLSKEIAIAQGKAFCTLIESGATKEAFWYQKTAVDFYCAEYSGVIQIVPTEKEQNSRYLDELREADLGGEFASDAVAIAAGRAICSDLDQGGKSQGPNSAAIAVRNFCPDYTGGFRELGEFRVTGTFVLYDEDYLCIGGGLTLEFGYRDINSETDVFWDNEKGDRLATTTLGTKTKSGFRSCTWTFSLDLPEGEERYVLSVGRRGTKEFTEAELKVPGAVALSLGSLF